MACARRSLLKSISVLAGARQRKYLYHLALNKLSPSRTLSGIDFSAIHIT